MNYFGKLSNIKTEKKKDQGNKHSPGEKQTKTKEQQQQR